VSPDGNAINCQSNIKVKCNHGMAVSVIANLLKQDKQLKMIFAEAVLLAISDADITQQISSDEFLDSILQSKTKETEL
jgi:hypothetical protein